MRRWSLSVPQPARGLLILAAVILFTVVYAYYVTLLGEREGNQTASAPSYHVIAALPAPDGFAYTGVWETVRRRSGGRSEGATMRSSQIGARATLRFVGRVVRISGIKGPDGGTAAVSIDGRPDGTANFFNAATRADAVVFESPSLTLGGHVLSLVVEPPALTSSARGYVEIAGAAAGT